MEFLGGSDDSAALNVDILLVRLSKLQTVVSETCKVEGQPVEQLQELGGESSRQDYERFYEVLTSTATDLEHDINRVAVGFPSMKKEEEVDSLLRGLLKRLELLVTCFYLVCANQNRCCEAARKEASIAVSALISSVYNVFAFMKDAQEKQFDIQTYQTSVAPKVGSVWEACKRVNKVAKTNRAAVKRLFLQTLLTVRDIHKEIQDIIKENATRQDGTSDDNVEKSEGEDDGNGNDENEPEVGSDEWYAMMDELDEDDLMEEEELTKVQNGASLFQNLDILLQAGAHYLGGTKPVSLDSDENMGAYVRWLNTLSESLISLGKGANEFALSLHPPHDLDKLHDQEKTFSETLERFHNIVVDGLKDRVVLVDEDAQKTADEIQAMFATLKDLQQQQ